MQAVAKYFDWKETGMTKVDSNRVLLTDSRHKEDRRRSNLALRRTWTKRFGANLPTFKRIRRWRDRRWTSLIRGQLVTHRRTSLSVRHKSRQHRHLRQQRA